MVCPSCKEPVAPVGEMLVQPRFTGESDGEGTYEPVARLGFICPCFKTFGEYVLNTKSEIPNLK
jgi:hypothetical protein